MRLKSINVIRKDTNMNALFDQKFKHGVLSSRKTRLKIYNFLKQYMDSYCKGTIISEKEKDELLYIIFYELYFEYQLNPCKENLIQYVKNKRFLYNHEAFDTIRYLLQEENKFITEPPTVDEGIIPCKFCKSKKTISFEKQTRSSDEAATLFISCVECKQKLSN